jgi:hypothetical protein
VRVINETSNVTVQIGEETYIRRSTTGGGAFWLDGEGKRQITDAEKVVNLETQFTTRNIPTDEEVQDASERWIRRGNYKNPFGAGVDWFLSRLQLGDEQAQTLGVYGDDTTTLPSYVGVQRHKEPARPNFGTRLEFNLWAADHENLSQMFSVLARMAQKARDCGNAGLARTLDAARVELLDAMRDVQPITR